MLGHSYGSTVVGNAARDHGVYADDIALRAGRA
ncbi:alpha/beta hydrolase [Saccharopolyspora hattusasensis]